MRKPVGFGNWYDFWIGLLVCFAPLVAYVAPASAEWYLMVNRDNKSWQTERAFVFEDDCKREAGSVYRRGGVLGVGCQEWVAPRETAKAPQGEQWAPPPSDYKSTYTACSGSQCIKQDTTVGLDSNGNLHAERTTTPFGPGSIRGTYRGSR
jgi:hypothetical protein